MRRENMNEECVYLLSLIRISVGTSTRHVSEFRAPMGSIFADIGKGRPGEARIVHYNKSKFQFCFSCMSLLLVIRVGLG